ncbi:MAG TPA: DinB family protein [Acidimicrobiales bacterium]|nr:DinB family protein [Acidimicrobiales bacterium]
MPIERPDPPPRASERETLVAFLAFHRATLEMKCDGLTPDQLRKRGVAPSPMSLIGLVRHLAEVERGWFRRGIAGEDAPPIYYSDAAPDGDFDVDDADVEEAFATWRHECEIADTIIAEHSLDDIDTRPDREGDSLRWILVHMVEEYARHNGHADLLRERIDGATGE